MPAFIDRTGRQYGRWLIMMGVVVSSDDLWTDLQQRIPVDIAQKLGIEPKEGA